MDRKTEVVITCNTRQPAAALRAMKKDLDALTKSYQQLYNSGEAGTAKAKQMKRDIDELTSSIKDCETDMEKVNKVVKSLSEASLSQLRTALKQVEKEMSHTAGNSPKVQELRKKYEALTGQISKLKGEMGLMTNSINGQASAWKTTIRNITTYFGLFQLVSIARDKMQQLFKMNFELSDQIANIRKVSGLAIEDVNLLTKNLAKIDTRTTIQELNDIAYAGAKLGLGKYGIEGLEGFVNAANQVNVALKEDLGADALTALSKITEVMGLIPKMGVERSMLAVGSAMFQLSATSTATSGNIVEFTKRLTGMARTAGITTDQLLAIGSAADAMYLMPEVASTAFSKLINSLQKNHNLIEKALEIEPGTINNLYSTGRTMDALVLIFEKMREKGNMNALQDVFKPLGSEGARLTNVMVTMAQNVDMLKSHLEVSKKAFAEATAVTQEYNIQQETAAALMERASNIWTKAFINPDGVDMVKAFAQEWYNLSLRMTQSETTMQSVRTSLGMIIKAAEVLIRILPLLIRYLMFYGVYAAIAKVVKGFVAMRAAIMAAEGATNKFNAALKKNLIGLAAAALATLITYLIDYTRANRDAAKSLDIIQQTEKEATEASVRERAEIKRLYEATQDLTASQEERLRAATELKSKYPKYFEDLTNEEILAGNAADAYKRLADEIYAVARARAYQDKLQELYEKQIEVEDKIEAQRPIVQAEQSKAAEEQFRLDQERNKRGFIPGYTVGVGMEVDRVVSWDKYNEENAKLKEYEKEQQQIVDDIKKLEEKIRTSGALYVNPDFNGTLDQDAADAGEKAEMRQQLKEAQDQVRAIIDNIKNFYQRQINEVLRTANEQNWDSALVEASTDAITARMNVALSQARKALAGQNNFWSDFKETMVDDMREVADEIGYNESQVLLDSIVNADPDAIRHLIERLSGKLGMVQNAAIDAIWKNSTLNEGANEKAAKKHRDEITRRLLEDNYTAKTNDTYTQSFENMGFFGLTDEQTATLLGGGKEAEQLIERRAKEIEQVLKNAREHIVDLYNLDPQSEGGRITLMSILFGPDWDQEESELKHVFEIYGDDMQVFYNELLKYSDDYTEALKRAHDRQKKIIDFQWKNSDTFKSLDNRQQAQTILASGVGQHSAAVQKAQDNGTNIPRSDQYGTGAFVSSMGEDPEIELYRLKMEAAARYYDYLEKNQADAQTLLQQEIAVLETEMAYVKAISSQMKERIDDMYALMSPVEEFGSAVGEVFANMNNDAYDSRDAFNSAIEEMIKAFMKQTVEMASEYAKRRIMQQMNDRLTSKAIKKSTASMVGLESERQEAITSADEEGGEARNLLVKSVEVGIQQTMQEVGQQTVQTHRAQAGEEVQTEAAKTQANTLMGIAGGAAKTIGSLGWWGIPLIAVITALLNGLLAFAMNKVSSLFGGGGGTDSNAAGPAVKLATGMLTYDSGNVQAFRGVIDGRTYPVVGSDGRVYAAHDAGELSTGLVRDPITTLVNGQPALVAERGPEMVIGRETTAAMMMNRPDLLAQIVALDRNRSGLTYQAYDSGNVASVAAAAPAGDQDTVALRSVIAQLSAVLINLQEKGIPAHINQYGRGGVVDSASRGQEFMSQFSSDPLYRGRRRR